MDAVAANFDPIKRKAHVRLGQKRTSLRRIRIMTGYGTAIFERVRKESGPSGREHWARVGRRAGPMVRQFEYFEYHFILPFVLSFHFVFLLLHAGDWSRFFRSARAAKNGKPGPPAGRGSHVDAVPRNSDGLTHDEETYAETVVSSRIEPGERLKENGICSPGMPIP